MPPSPPVPRRFSPRTGRAPQERRVIFDVDYRAYSWDSVVASGDVCRRLAALSDIIVGNDEEYAMMAGAGDGENLARAMAEEAQAVIYKMGQRGARTFSGGRVMEFGVYPVTPLKPTGAGDAFMAGFATGLAHGMALDRLHPARVGRGGHCRNPGRLRARDA